jgi:hypothetical protein
VVEADGRPIHEGLETGNLELSYVHAPSADVTYGHAMYGHEPIPER